MNRCYSFLTSHDPHSASQDANAVKAFSIIIRQAQAEDLALLSDILADSFHSKKGFMRWVYPVLRLGIYEDLRNRLRSCSPHYVCLVAVATITTELGRHEELVGTVELALRSPPSWQPHGIPYPYISNLAVKQLSRRQGVAKQLLLTCERTALEWGAQILYLHVLENNHPARQLYLQTGYQLQQIEPDYSLGLFGSSKRLFLSKRLTPPTSRGEG